MRKEGYFGYRALLLAALLLLTGWMLPLQAQAEGGTDLTSQSEQTDPTVQNEEVGQVDPQTQPTQPDQTTQPDVTDPTDQPTQPTQPTQPAQTIQEGRVHVEFDSTGRSGGATISGGIRNEVTVTEYQVLQETITVRIDPALTVQSNQIQAVYYGSDGSQVNLDSNYWTVDQASHTVTFRFAIEGEAGSDSQMSFRIGTSAQISGTERREIQNSMDLSLRVVDTLYGVEQNYSGSATSVVKYRLILDLGGGSLSGRSGEVTWNDAMDPNQSVSLSDIPAPTRSGYLFDGWVLSQGVSGGGRLSDDGTTLTIGTEDLVLSASWYPSADELVYDPNGGSGRRITVRGTVYEDVTVLDLGEVSFSREGYKLAGWCTVPDPTDEYPGVTYQGGDAFTLTRGDDILYAVWSPMYTVTYNPNGGVGEMPRRIYAASDSPTALENAFTRDGYTFVGWGLSADGRGTLYQPQDVIPLSGDLVLYAQWEQIYVEPETVEEPASSIPRLPILIAAVAGTAALGLVIFLVVRHFRGEDEEYPEEWEEDYPDEENAPRDKEDTGRWERQKPPEEEE